MVGEIWRKVKDEFSVSLNLLALLNISKNTAKNVFYLMVGEGVKIPWMKGPQETKNFGAKSNLMGMRNPPPPHQNVES